MLKRTVILFFPCLFLFLTGCGIKGELYLPDDPTNAYLSRIEKSIDEMRQQATGSEPAEKDTITYESEK